MFYNILRIYKLNVIVGSSTNIFYIKKSEIDLYSKTHSCFYSLQPDTQLYILYINLSPILFYRVLWTSKNLMQARDLAQ